MSKDKTKKKDKTKTKDKTKKKDKIKKHKLKIKDKKHKKVKDQSKVSDELVFEELEEWKNGVIVDTGFDDVDNIDDIVSEDAVEPEPTLNPSHIEPYLSGRPSISNYEQLFECTDCCYLIDYENVKANGLVGMTFISEGSNVALFYSKNADKMPLDILGEIQLQDNISTIKVGVGRRNALDFQLVSLLGYLIAEHRRRGHKVKYYLITGDTGFNSVLHFWQEFGVAINRGETIADFLTINTTQPNEEKEAAFQLFLKRRSEQPSNKVDTSKDKTDTYSISTTNGSISGIPLKCQEVVKMLPISEAERSWVLGEIRCHKAKQPLYQALVKMWGNDKGSYCYNTLKKYLPY